MQQAGDQKQVSHLLGICAMLFFGGLLVGLLLRWPWFLLLGVSGLLALVPLLLLVRRRNKRLQKIEAQLPDAMAKEGAEGVFAAGLPDGTAVAVKIADGAARAAGVVAASALAAVGHDVDAVAIGDPIKGHGRPVGQLRPLVGGG